MLPKTWSFVKRNRTKIAAGGITAALLGGLYYYFHQSKKGAEDEQMKEFFVERMNYSFSSSQRTANRATRNLLAQTCSILCDDLMQLDDTIAMLKGERVKQGEQDEEALQRGGDEEAQQQQQTPRKLDPSEKRRLWEKIKVEGIARTVSAIYTITLLHMLLSIEVNIIGRYLFLNHMHQERKQNPQLFDNWPKQMKGKSASNRRADDSSRNGYNGDDEVIELSKETQQQFMSYAGHFQMEGARQLSDIVLQETRRIVDPIPLAQVCTPQDMYDLLESVRAGVERKFMFSPEEDPQINLCRILLPPEESQDPNEMHPHLLDLLDELRDILESEEFVQVFRETSTSCFTVLYSQLEKHIIASQRRQSGAMAPQTTASSGSEVPTIHLANLVPRITKEAKSIFQDSSDNAYVDAVQDNQLLMRFCFMTYSLGVQI